MSAVVVADASPLIAFQQIGQLQLLRTIFGELTVPPAVAREILPTVPPTPWILERRLTQPIAPFVLRANLGAGESEALSLAVEIRADLLFVDERAGRRVAAALGVSVVGTLGVLLAAKRTGSIAEVRPVVDELAPRLVKQALLAAGEEGADGRRWSRRSEALSLESRFDLAYNAAHALALAALRLRGYRSDSRFLVFQVLPHTLGLPPATWRVLSKGHETRNMAEYEGALDVDEGLVADLIKAAEAVRVALRAAGLPPEV